jgi:predicted dehydrogenase
MIRWGVIGCGAVTEKKSTPAFLKVDGFEVVGCFRRDQKKAEEYVKRHNIPLVYKDAQELIDDPKIDAIYIATPPDSHKEYALKVANVNKICCIEKPMAPTYEDAKIIHKAFKEKDLPLFISYYRRSLPRFLKVKEWLESKKIGEVRHVNWTLHKKANDLDLNQKPNWRTQKEIAVGGYFDDVGSHGLDLLNFLLGDIVEVKGISLNQQNLYTSKDALTACWLHPKGVTGNGSWNFGSYKREDIVTIYGSRGKITFSALDEHPIVLESEDENESLFIENPENIQLYHAKNIKKHLEKNYTHPSPGESGLHTAWFMDRIVS